MVSLKLENITVRYPNGNHILDDVSFSVESGSIACILGPTGCGKTTTLRTISGLIKSTGGRITIDHMPLSNGGVRIGYVFQEPRLLPWRSALGNVEFSLEAIEQNIEVRRKRAIELMKLVGLGGKENDSPSTLSGGEKQRISLARALATDPVLLLADEPFNSLDISTRRRIIEEFATILENAAKTAIFVTHDLFEALYLADRLIVYSTRPATVKANLKIEEGRPRDLTTPGMVELRREVVDLLEA